MLEHVMVGGGGWYIAGEVLMLRIIMFLCVSCIPFILFNYVIGDVITCAPDYNHTN
jgi:hypothetical protein